MKKNLNFANFFVLAVFLIMLGGCYHKKIGDYLAAASISKGGFARDRRQMEKVSGHQVKLWGFVDYANIYSGGIDGSHHDSSRWRFDLKGAADDAAGASIPVYLQTAAGREWLIRIFRRNEAQGRPTRVFVAGKLLVHDAPINFQLLTGLSLEVDSAADILLNPPGEKD